MEIKTYKAIQFEDLPEEFHIEIVEFFTNDFNNDVQSFERFTIDENKSNLMDLSKFLLKNGFENSEDVLIEGIY